MDIRLKKTKVKLVKTKSVYFIVRTIIINNL